MPTRSGPKGSSAPRRRWAMVSTYPPTMCGIATFARSLVTALSALGTEIGIVRAVDADQLWPAPGVIYPLVPGEGVTAAAALLNEYEVVVVQHEFGIYGGEDGDQLLALLERLRIPVVTVLHTVLSKPTAHQRQVLQSIITASQLLVTMTQTAQNRLLDGYDVDPSAVLVIPHGAADQLVDRSHPARTNHLAGPAQGEASTTPPRRPVVLTWGLLGQGKGIEWGIEALATLQDLTPRPVYVVAGQTHPRVREREGEAYRNRLAARASALGIETDVVFEDGYLDTARLHRLVHGADIVLLPYDSRDQVTSGVLSEAVAAGRPVVSTRFPHAVELLERGMGLLVEPQDPQGIADALRRILTEPGLAAQLSARSEALAPALSWRAVARRYLAAGVSLRTTPCVGASRTEPAQPSSLVVVA